MGRYLFKRKPNITGYLISGVVMSKKLSYECRLFLSEHDQMKPNEQPLVCAKFGCGKHLSLEEQLYSNFCFNHSNPK